MSDTSNKDDKSVSEPATVEKAEADVTDAKEAIKESAKKSAKEPATTKAETPAKVKASKAAVVKEKKPKAWIAGSLALVALGATAALGYLGHQQLKQLQTDLTQQQSQVSGTVSQIKQTQEQLTSLAKRLQSTVNSSAGVVSQLNGLTDIVANNQRRIDEVAGTERSDWQLAEAEYLLRLANQRLLMSGEVRGSKALLQAADNVLVELDDVGLIPVRQAIAADVASLNRADNLDIEGLYLRVAALASNVEYLSLRSNKQWSSQALPEEKTVNSDNAWQNGLQKAWAKLSSLVVIRQTEQRVLPAMSEVEVVQLQQGLHYLIEQAKYAVITGKQGLYEASISDLRRWVLDYYDAEARTTGAMLSELQLLSDAQVSQAWPDISGSLSTLKMVMKDRLGLPARDSAQSSRQGGAQ